MEGCADIQKSVEEAKQEHVDKVGELLKWVSEKSKSLAKRQLEPPAERAGVETSLSEKEVLHVELSSKKDQIDEAVHVTQMFLAKHSDKISEEDKQQTEKQLESLQEAYNRLCEETSDDLQQAQSTLAEEAVEKGFETVAGAIDLATGTIYPIFHAIRNGLIDYDTGMILLEAQVIVSGLILPETKQCLGMEEALRYQLIDGKIFNQLEELSNSAKLILSTLCGISDVHSAADANDHSTVSEISVIKVLEAQFATGGLRVPATGEKLSLEEAFQREFITAQLYFKLLERQKMCKDLIDPITAEKVSLMELMQRVTLDKETGLRLLHVKQQEGGTIILKSGRQASVFRAVHEGLIDREVMIRLLGAQLFAGGLIDPQTGSRLTVDEALEICLIDHDTASGLLTHQVQTGGIISPATGSRLTMDEAVQCNLITSSSALLVLESQRVFMGLIWPDSGEIFSIDTSLQQGVVTNELAHRILNNRQKIAALYIPESSSVLTPEEASKLGVIDKRAAKILSTATMPDLMPSAKHLQSSHADISSWGSNSEVQMCATSDTTDVETRGRNENSTLQQMEVQQKFISYLMMHSYMDAGSGRRLLLVNSDLNEKIKMVLEASGADVPSENWQEYLHIQDGSGLENHLEAKDADILKNHTNSITLGPYDTGEKQAINALGEHCGTINSEALYWMPGVQQFPASEPVEFSYSQTMDSPGNHVTDTKELNEGKAIHAIETLDNLTDILEEPPFDGNLSAYPDLNESIKLTRQTGNVNSVESDSGNQLRKSAAIPKPDSQAVTTALETADLYLGDKAAITMSSAEQAAAETMHRFPMEQLFPASESLKLSPFPLDMDLQRDFGEDLNRMLGFDGPPGLQCGDNIGSSTEDSNDPFVICAEHANKTAQNWNAQQYMEASQMEESDGVGGRQSIAGLSVDKVADNTVQSSPLGQQLMTRMDEFISPALETVAATREDLTCGENNIRTVETLEDIAFADEMVYFVGAPDAARLSEEVKIDEAMKVEGDEQSFKGGKHIPAADEDTREDTNLENQVSFPKFTETNLDSQIIQGSMEEMWDVIGPSVEEHLTVANKILHLSPLETGSESKHCTDDSGGHEDGKHKVIRVIETLDDIADLEDKMEISGEPVTKSSSSKNDKPCSNEDYNEVAFGNGLSGFAGIVEGDSIHQYTDTTSALDDNFEYGRNKVITSVEGLEDIAENQEMPWFVGDIPGMRETLMLSPSGIEDITGVFEPSIQMAGGEANFLGDEDFKPSNNESDQSHQMYHQDFGIMKGQEEKGKQVNIELMHEAIQSYGAFEQDASGGNLTMSDTMMINRCLDLRCTLQEEPSDCAVTLENAEGIQRINGRNLYVLEEEDEENDGKITCFEAAGSGEWARSALIKQRKSEVEVGGIFDPVTGKRYRLEVALARGLLDEEIFVDILASQFQDGGILFEESGKNLTLSEAVAKGLLQSHVAIKVLDKLGLIGGFYNSGTGEIIEVADVAEQMINDDLLTKVLLSEKIVCGIIDPETNKLHSVHDAQRLGILNTCTALRLLEGQVVSGGIVDLKHQGRLSVAVTSKLCLVDEKTAEQLIKIEKAQNGGQVDEVTKLRALSYQLEMYGILDPQTKKPLSVTEAVNRGLVERDALLSVLGKQVEAGGIIQHKSGLRLSVTNALRHSLINEDLADDLFELEAACQNIHASSAGKNLCSQKIAPSSKFPVEIEKFQKANELVTEFENGKSAVQIESVGERLLDDSLHKEMNLYESEDNVDERQLPIVSYSDLARISKIDIDTGRRYMAVKPLQEVLNVKNVETMSKLNVVDVDLSNACSTRRKELNDQTLICAKEDKSTVQDFLTRSVDNHQINSSTSNFFIPGRNQDSFVTTAQSASATHISEDDLPGKLDRLSSKSPYVEDSPQGDFFSYIRECTSDIELECEASKLAGKENVLSNEDGELNEVGKLTVETFIGGANIEELESNNRPSSTNFQGLMGTNGECNLEGDIEGGDPNVKLGLLDKAPLTGIFKERNQGIQNSGLGDCAEGFEQNVNMAMSVGNVLKAVCMKFSNAFKIRPKENPNEDTVMNGNRQEKEAVKTLNDLADLEGKAEFAYRVKEMSIVSGARGNEGETSDHGDENSFGESEDLLCQEGIDEEMQDQDVEGGQKLEKPFGKTWDSFELEKKANLVSKEERLLSLENVLGFAIDEHESLEKANFQRVIGVNIETGDNQEADHFSLMECNTEVGGGSAVPAVQDVVTCGDAPADVKNSGLVLDCLKREFLNAEFSELFGLKDDESRKMAALLAALKPEMMSAQVQGMLCALSEEQDTGSLRSQELVSSLTDELFRYVKNKVPGSMEDRFLNRQVKEMLCERIPLLLSTAEIPQDVSQQTIEEGNMYQIIQMKANGNPVNHCGSSHGELESREGTDKVALCDSPSKDDWFNNDESGDTMNGMPKIKQDSPDSVMQSADVFDEMEPLEDTWDKGALEDPPDNIWIGNNEGVGELKEMLQVRLAGQCVSENENEEARSDSLDQIDLLSNIQGNTYELSLNEFRVQDNKGDNEKGKTEILNGQNITDDKSERLVLHSPPSDKEEFPKGNVTNNVGDANKVNEREMQTNGQCTNQETSEDSFAMDDIQEQSIFEDTPNSMWINNNKDDMKKVIEIVASGLNLNEDKNDDLLMQPHNASDEMKPLESTGEKATIKTEQHEDRETLEGDGQPCNSTQQCLQHMEKVQAHLTLVQKKKIQLENLQPVDSDLEILQEQLDYHTLLMCELEETVTRDLRAAEKFLEDIHLDHDEPLLKNLETDCKDLQTSLGDVTDVCANGVKTLSSIIEMEQFKVKSTHQEFLAALDRLSGRIQENAITLETLLCDNPGDLEALKSHVQQHKDLEKTFTDLKIQLDATTFEVQFFVSEHALDLSPQENRKLLKLLNSTQTSFKSAMEKLAAQLEVLNLQLQTRLEQDDQKAFEEKQGDCNKRLQEMCDLLLVTESKIIDYDNGMSTTGDGLADLQQHQVEHQALQREIQANATTLANVVSATEEFLEKNGDKLQPEERAAMDKKLKNTKAKLSVLSDQVDSNLKNIDNAVTTALKQETEKAAAVEQLKENENKIQGLLGWLSSIGPETVQQNGNTIFVDGLKRLENEDTVNGNLPRELSETKGNETMESTTDGDLNYQYQKAKLHHQQVMSQQQSYIISTQSVQDFLKKQGSSISAEEREKLEQDLNELKVQYETALAQSESRLKLVHTVQDELQKFSTDYSEFDNWLHESEQQLGDLQSGATDVEIFVGKLQRQKSFSEDVISHKGDLRYITISGQRVLDAAKPCGKLDLGKDAKPCIDTSATCALVQRQLEVASDCYKLLHSKCNTLGKNLKDVVDKYSQYQEISASLLPWLQVTEEAAKSQLAEAITADPQNLQKQLEQVKALQDQMSGHQSVVENLRKTVDALISTDGDLLLNRDEIQDHLDDVVLRYESLSKSTNDRNEKLRMTLTRSLSVQDGLDEMLDWMEGVEKSLEDEKDMPLNSAAIQEAFSKNAALEQNIASRQSSIRAIKEKANKFIATADMSSASALQAKVDELAKRFTSASGRQKERTTKLEKLRDKVERFEKTYQKIEQFVTKKGLSVPEIDGPGKDVTELSQHMQEMNTELLDQSKDLNTLNQLAEELGGCATAKERTQILNKVNTLSKNFQELEEAIKKKEEKLSCYQHQSDQFKALLMVFKKWVEGMNSRIPIIEPSLTTETLQGHLSKVQVILNEWSSNASLVEEVNQNGSALCHLINTLISPAHSRTIFKSGTQVANGGGAVSAVCDSKELITIQQDIADVNHQYEELGGLLKNKGSQLESMLARRQQVQEEAHLVKEWLESMDKRTASWDTLPTETEAIKEQVEQHKAFEAELNQKTGKVGQLKEKLSLLLKENTDSPEAGKWRQMLDYIDSKWQQVSQSAAERQQKLEESSSFLIQFETAEMQLSQWLVEKELMMNVLGPLSIDPHMLNNQKQQVQILLKEFESRKPQHEQLKTAADGILSRSDDPTPACGVVSDQLAAVMHKWDNLTGKLVDRSDLIDQAIVKSTRYQNLVRDLSGRLSALDIKLARQPPIGSQPEAVKSQLEAASEIRSEVEQEEKSMQEAQTLCEEISSLVGEQYLKAELSRQLDNVLKPFRDLEERAGNRVHQLQSALANSEQFQQMFDDFQAWMDGQRREQDQRAPVSAKLECLHLLIDEQAEFKKSLAQKAGSYEMILVEGEALLQNMQPGAEKTALQGRLGTLRADWEELARQVEARQEKMRDCFQKAQKYRECVEHLLPWIQECEAKASRVQVCSDAAEIESSLASIRGLQTDVDKHRRVLESLNNAADSLIEVSQTDLDDIQNEKASVNQRVDLINEQLRLKISSLDEMAKCMKEFQNSLKDAKKQLDGAKQQLELHDALGPQAYSNKCLTNMNAQQKTLQALTLQVENVGRLAQRLAAGTSDGAGTSLILRQAGTLQEDYGSVSQQVRERCCFLETKLQGIGRFQNNIREMFSLFADLDDELDSMAPVGRHLSCLHVQKDGIREFIVRLQELTASIQGAKIEGRQLLESASSPDLLGLKRDLDALSKQCNKLLDRAMVRQEQVETNLARIEEFDSRCKTFSKLVAIAEQHEESQGSVGTETDIINQQLESFKVGC
ncbi:hypothetical protein scyTo_0004458 [Scyliorhinus torazame]|uniref:Dystonin n=1 Tax=Scyliorhinus torazame TaxID=75743 RepID=A0A401NRY0_SCYTO|nr:hypothetical protein [Scyliorhinus torazame]